MTSWRVTAGLNIRSGPGAQFERLDGFDEGDVIDEVQVEGWCPVEIDDGSIGWVSRKYLKPEVPEETAADVPVITPSAEPIQIRWARSKLGQKEVPGSGDNPEIVSWFKLLDGFPKELWHDVTAWCAVFVNAALCLNGIAGIRSADAYAWLKFGTKVTAPKKGDVVVFQWANGEHHVALYLADAGERIQVIGGNQSDAVTITTFAKANVLGYRRAA